MNNQITPQYLKQTYKDYVENKRELYKNNKKDLLNLVLKVLEASAKSGTIAVSLYQILDVRGYERMGISSEVFNTLKDNLEDIRTELECLGFKFNEDKPEYIVFEEQ